jgi:hypothetical protein
MHCRLHRPGLSSARPVSGDELAEIAAEIAPFAFPERHDHLFAMPQDGPLFGITGPDLPRRCDLTAVYVMASSRWLQPGLGGAGTFLSDQAVNILAPSFRWRVAVIAINVAAGSQDRLNR